MTSNELKAAMTAQGWTIAAFARYLDRTQNAVRAWRNGSTPVPRYVEIILEKERQRPAE